MGLISNEVVYKPRIPESGDSILGVKRNDNEKTVTFSVDSIVSLLLANLIGDTFASDTFTYNGTNNTFILNSAAFKVTMVYIDNGAYPSQVPIGNVTQVIVDNSLLLSGQSVVIHYIKLG
tara:strand:+ start:78 stop:437 length:360 start_codon:yes stop_codon:yes gene_type:complete